MAAAPPAVSPYDAPRIRAQLQRWKERLLDLSRANPLLGVNRSRVTKLRIKAPSPLELFQQLVVDEATLRFPLIKEARLEPSDEDGEPTTEWDVTPGDLDFEGTPEEIARKMRRLYDNARTTIEERGVTTLYATFGILDWEDPNLGRSLTPIWMVPCHIERTSQAAPLKLERADEEIQLNPALALFLRERHKIELPALPEDETTTELQAHLAKVKDVVRETGWKVLDEVWLSTFTFESIVLYQDLTAMADPAVQNPLIAALARAGGEPNGSEALGDDLDEVPSDHTPLPVIATDSSQFEALARAIGGRHLVVHGPPGTGKSQTIAALIADALGRGQTVLFVSAKMAALEVVYRRLREVGLADFCLEAHSTKAGKAKIIDELRRTLDSDITTKDGALAEETEQLRRTRGQLNEYVRALHDRIAPLDITTFMGIARFARRRSAAELRFDLPWRDVLAVTKSELAGVCDLIDELAGQSEVFERRTSHPWRGLVTGGGGLIEREAIEASLVVIARSAATIEQLCAALNLDTAPLSFAALDASLPSLQAYAEAEALPSGWRTRPLEELTAAAERLEEAAGMTKEAGQLLEQLNAVYVAPPETVAEVLQRRIAAFPHWWQRATPGYWQWSRELHSHLRAGARVGQDDYARHLGSAARYLELRRELASREPELAQVLGDRTREESVLSNAAEEFRRGALLRTARFDATRLGDPNDGTREQMRSLIAALPSRDDEVRSALERLATWWPEGFVGTALISNTRLADIGVRCAEIAGSPRLMDEWVLLQRTMSRCTDAGLRAFVDSLRPGDAAESRRIFERRFYSLWASAAIARSPVLEGFLGSRREDLIRRFAELDENIRVAAARQVRATAGEPARRIRRADPTMGTASEVGILRLELGKRRRLKPLRRLFDEIPNVLQALKPCMLMSPVSVSTYLKPGALSFDLVVFDEASQIPTQEAVPAMLRANQTVVAGDAHQLPPTRFFMSSFLVDDDGEVPDESFEPLESLLDDAVAIVPHFDETDLRWHYRSRDERLIAFSNHYFYEERLHTFPSATTSSDDRGVHLVHVPDGVYGRGRARDHKNPREARRVAQLVLEQLDAHPERSLGVVAMNIDQRDAIVDAIDEELAERPDLRALWDRQNEEPAFVKALENVQGDERDTMLISVGYGRDTDGALTFNFGPLNADGGERRLNVLVTRAKWQTIVVSSIRASELAGVNPNNKGASALKNYLAYAESGGVLPRPPALDTDAETNDFEDAVREALIDRGLQVDAQVGAGRYRIDLAISDRRDPQRYVLGVECDGATYHGSRSARDRDLLRHNVLRDMGWRLHRLWSTEWFRDPDAAIAGVLRSLEQAEHEPVDRSVETTRRKIVDIVADESSASPTDAPVTLRYPSGQPYVRYSESILARDQLLSARFKIQLAKTIARIVAIEAPLLEDVLIDRLRDVHGVGRAGNNIRQNVNDALAYAKNARLILLRNDGDDHVITRPDFTLAAFRTPTDEVTRAIEEIPKEELALAALHLVETQFGMQRERIASEVAHLFGFDRARAPAADRIRDVVDGLVNSGQLRTQGPNVYLA